MRVPWGDRRQLRLTAGTRTWCRGALCLAGQSCLTLCSTMDYSLPDSFVHGILLARILEGVAIPFSKESSWPRDRTQVSCIAGRFFIIWTTRKTKSDILDWGVLIGMVSPGVSLLAQLVKSRKESDATFFSSKWKWATFTSPGNYHFDTKTWSHTAYCRLHC